MTLSRELLSKNGLTLLLLVANFANAKWCKKPEKMTETLSHGYSSESTQQELSNVIGLDGFQKSLCPCVLDKSSFSIVS